MKSYILTSLTACATFSTVLAAVLQPRDTCASPVTLTGNAFATRQLFATPYYAAKVAEAVTRITDPSLAARAAQIGRVGTFMWIDQIAVIPTIDAMIKAVPCTHIIGFVIYDLPGRDCGGEASGGEYDTGELARYKAEYIDPIRRIILANPNVAIALIIEPDSLPNAITALNHPRCFASVQEYKDGIAYALAQFNLPNVVMYIDAGNGNWLGWDPNVAPAAKVIADVWKAAGSPGQVRGIATNVANWNAWSMIPGEFENFPDAQYNKAQDEKRYVHLLGAELAANGMPNHAIIDTSRNGVLGLRLYGGDWCNVAGAGFGVRPTSETDDDLADAFVWVKLGGESDGISDPSDPRYDTTCGRPDAFKPSPLAGLWNQAQFEQLVANAIPDVYTTDGRCHANIFCGSWPAGSCCTNGVCGTSCGSTCTSGCGDQGGQGNQGGQGDQGGQTYSKCEGEGYPDMKSIEDDKANIEVHCMNYRIAQVLYKIAKQGLADYEKLMKDDYQKKFDYYAKYILELAPPMVEDFMTKNASNYFDCYEKALKPVARTAQVQHVTCAGCGVAPNCGSYIEGKMAKCPTTIPHDSATAGRPNEVRYELQAQRETPLKNDLLQYQGVDPGWWNLGKQLIFVYKVGNPSIPKDCCLPCTDPASRQSCVLYYDNFPIINKAAKVEDPEDVLTDSITKMRTMVENLHNALTELYDQTFVGNTADVIRGAEYAVNFITQGVDSMNGIVETASEIAEIKKQEQISFIVGMITSFIGFIPFAGTALREVGLVIAARIITIIGEVSEVALNLYAFVSAPDSVANIMFVMIDAVSIGAPRWAQAAESFRTFRNTYKYGGLSSKELTRSQVVDRIIVASFQFHG